MPDAASSAQWNAALRSLFDDARAASRAADSISRRVLAGICELTGWPLGQVHIVDTVGTAHRWVSWQSDDERWVGFVTASGDALSAGVGLPGRVVGSGRPAWVDDVWDDRNFPRADSARAVGLHGGLAFPVCAAGEVIAVFEFFSERAINPSTDFLEAVESLSQQLASLYIREGVRATFSEPASRLRQVLDSAGEAFIGMDERGCVTEWNRQAEKVFGWRREEIRGLPVSQTLIPESYREAHDKGVQHFLQTGSARVLGQTLEVSGLRQDGTEFPLEMTLWALRESDSWAFYAFARDITARKQAEAELARDAMHDPLTGLANRTVLMNQLSHALSRMSRGDDGPALLFADLDRFKPINDTFGHDAGDQVLIAVAQRLSSLVRDTDVVARLAGDEFVVLLDETPTARDAALVASRIVESLAEPIPVHGYSLTISASVGVAVARPDSTAQSLVDNADAAMYQAKHAGRGRYDIYGERLRDRVTSRLRRETELSRALGNGEFELHYQPVFSLPDLTLNGVEALLRWHHPTEGLVAPGNFIDVAEESGQIVSIGDWVLKEACTQLGSWRESFGQLPIKLQLAVNLSSRQLSQPQLVETVAGIMANTGLPEGDLQLCLEVTESVLMNDPQAAAATLEELRSLGASIAVDDFGTGYSSLAYLKWFPVDTVKIDRAFISTITTDPTDRAIVQAVIALTRELGMKVVAEGVETEEQLELLIELGCPLVQGFLLGRPQPASLLESLIASRAGMAPVGRS